MTHSHKSCMLRLKKDDPRFKRNRKTSQEEPSWKAELQKLVRFQKILESKDIDLKVIRL